MAINSLGLGSGVLTADVLDQLKENDRSIQINPIEAKIELNKKKSDALKTVDSLMSTFRSSVSALGSNSIYQNRIASATGDAVSVTAASGVSVQDFSLEVTQLAKKDIIESNTFSASDAKVASGDGTMQIGINGINYDVDYTADTTLEELAQSINDTAGSSVKAKILEVGTNDFRLILTSQNEGADNDITLSDSGNMNDPTASWTSIQDAVDAEFKYDGITLTRSTNSVDDLIVGVTLNFNEIGSSNVSIKQDQDEIKAEMQNLTDAYNALQEQLNKLTTSDVDEGTVGLFNGDNTIKNIAREINKVLTQQDANGNSIVSYGFDLSQTGRLSFDGSEFLEKFNEDPTANEKFFSGGTVINSNGSDTFVNGAFNDLKDKLDNYIGSNGSLTTYSTQLSDNTKTFNEDKAKALKLLDQRYDTMTQRFIAYDSLISRLNAQFASLSQQISMAVNGSNN